MLKQIKYAARDGIGERISATIVCIVVNAAFLIAGMSAIPHGVKILGVVLSSLALLAMLIAAIIADIECVRGLFGSPNGYNAFLTPVPRWKLLLGRLIPMALMDLAMLAIGTVGVVIQTIQLSGHTSFSMLRSIDFSTIMVTAVSGILQYLMLLLFIFLAGAMWNGLFYRLRARMLLAVTATLVIAYVCNIMDLILAPIMYVERWNLMFSLNFAPGLNLPTFAYLLLLVAKDAALFAFTVYIMERKINV